MNPNEILALDLRRKNTLFFRSAFVSCLLALSMQVLTLIAKKPMNPIVYISLLVGFLIICSVGYFNKKNFHQHVLPYMGFTAFALVSLGFLAGGKNHTVLFFLYFFMINIFIYMRKPLLFASFIVGFAGHIYYLPKLNIPFQGKMLDYLFYMGYFLASYIVMHFSMRIFQIYTADLRDAQRKTSDLNDALQIQSEQLEIKNEQLIHSQKVKDQVIANTSHELRTPINHILGLSQGVLENTKNEALKQQMKYIMESGNRLAVLVDDILDFSNIKSNQFSANIRPVALKEAVDVAIHQILPQIGGKPLQIINKVPETGIPAVQTDEVRLHQMFRHFLGNAIKFSEQGTITVMALHAGPFVRIDIQDEGIGMSEEQLKYVFEVFEQGDGSAERKFGGTGLGLALCKELAEMMGGSISVMSKAGKGSVFSISLPASTEPAQAVQLNSSTSNATEEKAANVPLGPVNAEISPQVTSQTHKTDPAPKEPLHNKTDDSVQTAIPADDQNVSSSNKEDEQQAHILIVDDEPVNILLLKQILQFYKFQVSTCSSGIEALRWMEDNPAPDLILLDVMMPGLNGYDTLIDIRKKHSLQELPVMLLTAKNRSEDIHQGFQSGANDYLVKPFQKTELLDRIQVMLHTSKLFRHLSRAA